MNKTIFAFRLAKIVAVSGVGILTFLITFNNITDYYSDYSFVEHVMKMDTTFPGNELMYRSFNSNIIHHITYILIILLEAVTTYCCLKGVWQMYRNINKKALDFQISKRWAMYGLILGIAIWFIVFQAIAGEWFAMWQSQKWNGLYSADRIVTFIGLSLIMLMQKEDELQVSLDENIR
jgi:predicted small integral membrane protein